MKRMRIQTLCAGLALISICLSCDEKSLSPSRPSVPDFSLTPMENEEAELAALHLSGELIAPICLYRRIKSDLEIIRSNWADSVEHVNIKFRPYWEPSRIQIYVSEPTYDSMIGDDYHYWDSLNDFHSIDTILFSSVIFPNSSYYSAHLYFNGRLNSLRLMDIYDGLPGTYAVTFVSHVAIGDRPMLVFYKDRETIKYFFRFAWGDCPSGCIYSDIYYFTVSKNKALFHGSHLNYPPDSVPPVWYDTFLAAYFDYFPWDF